jgi:hypothetical protein
MSMGIMPFVSLIYSVSPVVRAPLNQNLIISLGTRIVHLNELGSDVLIGCALIWHGIMPSAPCKPSVTITIQTLELYCLAHFHCPQLSISAFVKALSDIHSVCHVALNNPEAALTIIFILYFISSNSKNILAANSQLNLTSTLLSVPKLTIASRNRLTTSPVTGAFAMPVQLAHTS